MVVIHLLLLAIHGWDHGKAARLVRLPMAVAVCREVGRQRKQSLMEQMRVME